MKNIVVVGTGGFAKEVAFLIKEINKNKQEWNFLGFITKYEKPEKGSPNNEMMNDEWLMNCNEEIYVAMGIGNPLLAKELTDKYTKNYHCIFPNIISPNAIGDWEKISIGKGNIITSGTIFTTDIKVGDFNIFNLNCTIGHDTVINNHNVINPSVNISGGVVINNENLIGTGSQILQYIKIDSNIVVGAGSTVVKDLIERGVYVGTPAKKIK